MANMTISNPGVSRFFSGLANALGGPSPQALIEADYKRVQRDHVLSDTAINQQKLQTMQREEAAMSQLAEVLGNPTLAQTPEGRASLMSILSQVPDGLQYGPKFATGASSFVDPNFVESDTDFSRILAGTGVQAWDNTPAGHTQRLENALALEQMKQVGETQRALLPGGGRSITPLAVNPGDATKFADMVDAAIRAAFEGNINIDPALAANITNRATQIYQINRNAPLAIEQAIQEAQLERVNPRHMLNWFEPDKIVGTPIDLGEGVPGLGAVLAPPVAAPITPAAPLPTPAPIGANTVGAAPAATPTVQAPPPGSGPSVHTDANGAPFMLGPDKKPIPIHEGFVIRSKSNPDLMMVWSGGTWKPLNAGA